MRRLFGGHLSPVVMALCVIVAINAIVTPVLWWQIQNGRRTAVRVVCASTSAVIEAGQRTISGPSNIPPKLDAHFQRYGYPSRADRERAAAVAADAYAAQIAKRIREETNLRGLVTADGRLDCDRLADVSRARH
jgi:hypothetical protein